VGELVLLSSARPAGVLLDGAPAKYAYDVGRARLSVDLPAGGALQHTLHVSF
jgi:hypothetical protein